MSEQSHSPRLNGADFVLSVILAGMMACQAGAGRIWPTMYRDEDWVRATWIGNDWVTLLLALPVLIAGILLARRGRARGWLLWFGGVAYGIYNYAFYIFGSVLNALFPLCVSTVVLAVITIIRGFDHLDARWLKEQFIARTPHRLLGGYLVFVASGLAIVWLGMWGAHVFAGRDLPVDEENFRVVAALDLGLIVPALLAGGVLLWRRHRLGFVIAPMAAIQGATYLTVLAVNALVMFRLGYTETPGEFVVWGPLAGATIAAAATILWCAGGEPRSD